MIRGDNNIGQVCERPIVAQVCMVLNSISEHQWLDRAAIDAGVQKYWNRKHGFDFHEDARQKRQTVEAQKAGIERKKRRQEITGKPLGTVVAGDPVVHVVTGRRFVVLEDRGDEIVVKGLSTPRLILFRTSLRQP